MKLGIGKIGAGFRTMSEGVPETLSRFSALWYLIGALVIGLMLARWTWILFSPQTLSVLPAKNEGVSDATSGLFGVASQADQNQPATAAVIMPSVRLVGVFSGNHGFAVLKLDDKRQLGVAIGEEIVNGTKLVEVAADHVLIESAGKRQRVDLESKAAAMKGAVVAQPSTQSLTVDQATAEWNKARQEMQNAR